ncbi:bone marrow stromal antigen 2 [Theropithecus gelada]|uniref:Bone marrow stromal antigen 2 n=1 Tax=Theropithecus gelada TaxID=9565 RepID=A0A8D2K0M6_THEGE|nr:bone marrow stromal antigen 2 [Theropithecus gelada]XP_025224384.1 bone marrow stromal antigen 2 [Theropithecus gelada]
MAPILYDYCKMSMDDIWKEDGDKRCKLVVGILGLLVIVLLGVPLIFFIIKANSEACQDGLRAVMECRNVTYLLQQELAEAQRGFRDAEAQAVTCNQTVMALMASLDAEKAQGRKKVEELEGEITTLNHKLQDASAEVERLRRENHVLNARIADTDSASSQDSSCAAEPPLLILLLGLSALLL